MTFDFANVAQTQRHAVPYKHFSISFPSWDLQINTLPCRERLSPGPLPAADWFILACGQRQYAALRHALLVMYFNGKVLLLCFDLKNSDALMMLSLLTGNWDSAIRMCYYLILNESFSLWRYDMAMLSALLVLWGEMFSLSSAWMFSFH